jgi:hypothetical protein
MGRRSVVTGGRGVRVRRDRRLLPCLGVRLLVNRRNRRRRRRDWSRGLLRRIRRVRCRGVEGSSRRSWKRLAGTGNGRRWVRADMGGFREIWRSGLSQKQLAKTDAVAAESTHRQRRRGRRGVILVLGLVVPHSPRGSVQAQAMVAMVDGAIVRRRSRGCRRRDGASAGMLPWLLRRITVHGGSEGEQRRERETA